jgi:hypothetical protein
MHFADRLATLHHRSERASGPREVPIPPSDGRAFWAGAPGGHSCGSGPGLGGRCVLVATSGGSRSPAVDLRGVDWENASVPAAICGGEGAIRLHEGVALSALAVGRMTGRATRQRKWQARLRSGPSAMRCVRRYRHDGACSPACFASAPSHCLIDLATVLALRRPDGLSEWHQQVLCRSNWSGQVRRLRRRRAVQLASAVQPPSTGRATPLMNPLRIGSARNATAAATSSGVANRPMGTCPTMSSSL